MKALLFSVNIPQWTLLQALRPFSRKPFARGPLATVRLAEVPEPAMPGDGWVKIETRLCGFCASDLNLIYLQDSPTASPFTSFPCIMGHEVYGVVAGTGAAVSGFEEGQRVVVAPHLDCAVRGIDPPCGPCARGRFANCENFAEGKLAPGMFTGICRDAGGGFAPFFTAHKSQLFAVPEEVPGKAAVLTEPLAVALQAVYDNCPRDGEHVLVIGGGVIGSLIVRVIRALEVDCRITVSDPAPTAANLAIASGADRIIGREDFYERAAEITGATVYKPLLGQRVLMGGYSRVFDAVGTSATLNTVLRCTGAGGAISLVGIGHNVKLDLTPMWLKHLSLEGTFAYGRIDLDGQQRHVFSHALQWLAEERIAVADMLTHTFALEDFEAMLAVNLNKEKHGAVKTAFSFEG